MGLSAAGAQYTSDLPGEQYTTSFLNGFFPKHYFARYKTLYYYRVPFQGNHTMSNTHQPLVICATGGSGAAPVAALCQKWGYYLGNRTDAFLQAPDFFPFLDTWVSISLSNKGTLLTEEQNNSMFQDFMTSIARHRSGLTNQNGLWGWHNARNLYLIPFFHALYPAMKCVHVVRDGRDIAFEKNPNELLYHTKTFFDKQYDSLLVPYRLMLLWNATNLTIASFCETTMPNNYLRLRYEDLIENPQIILKRLGTFLKVTNVDFAALSRGISGDESIGRWQVFPIDTVEKLKDIGREALMKFGYAY